MSAAGKRRPEGEILDAPRAAVELTLMQIRITGVTSVSAHAHRLPGISPGLEPRETRAWSGAGRHVGGQDVVRLAVEVLAGTLVTHWWCAGRRDGRRSGLRVDRRQVSAPGRRR
jgi:hypothetical protein